MTMENYLRLLDKIDGFAAELRRRHPGAFACGPGCADCCVAGIRVWRIEFDRIGDASRLQGDVSRLGTEDPAHLPKPKSQSTNRPCPERETSPISPSSRCPLLDGHDRCSIYDARPAVCRLWGAPLLFRIDDAAAKLLLHDAKKPQHQSQTPGGIITCCPKNDRNEAPFGKLAAADTINMEIVLSALAAINHIYCKGIGEDPSRRYPLADLL